LTDLNHFYQSKQGYSSKDKWYPFKGSGFTENTPVLKARFKGCLINPNPDKPEKCLK